MKQRILSALGNGLQSVRLKELMENIGGIGIREDAPESNEFYLQFYSRGVSLLFDESGMLSTVLLYVCPNEGFSARMPEDDALLGLDNMENFSAVRLKFGEPTAYSEAKVGTYGLVIPEWARYDKDTYSAHIEFGKDSKGISRITYMRNDVVPRL